MDIGSLIATLGVDTKGLDTAKQKMVGFTQTSTAMFGKIQKSVFSLQGALLSLGVGFSVSAIKRTAAEYQSALTDMAKVTDISRKQIDKTIKALSPTLGNSTELMRGYYQVISAGVTEPVKALDLLTTAAKTAKVAHVEQAETVTAITKLLAGYAGQIKNAAQASDLLLSIEKQGQTDVGKLVGVIGNIATISRTAGLSFQEMGAALSLITQTAGSTEEAVTQLAAMETATLRATEQMTAAFKEYGGAVNYIKKFGLEKWLLEIQRLAGGSAEKLSELLGGRKEAMMATSALLAKLDAYRINLAEIEKGAGGLERQWAKVEAGFNSAERTLKNKLINSMIELGSKVLPMLTVGLHILIDNYDRIAKAIEVLFKVGAVYIFSRMAVVLTFSLLPALKMVIAHLMILRKEFALIAGYEIGTWLYKEFETARLAGLALTDGIIKGWMLVKQATEVIFTGISFMWNEMLYGLKKAYSSFINFVATIIEKIPQGLWEKLGLDKQVQRDIKYAREFANTLGDKPSGLLDALGKIADKYEKNREIHRRTIDGLIKDAVQYGKIVENLPSVGGLETPVGTDESIAGPVAGVDSDKLAMYQDFYSRLQQLRMNDLEYAEWALMQEVAALREAKIAEVALIDEYEKLGMGKIAEERIKTQQEEMDNLLQMKMELYKDLEGFEEEYRAVQLEYIEKIRRAEIKATKDELAANKKAQIAIGKLRQAEFEATTDLLSSGLTDMEKTFSAIGNMFGENSKEYSKMQEAIKVLTVAQNALAVSNAVATIANQGLGDPYTAFARIAAMTSAMAALLASAGISFSGGGASGTSAPTPPKSTVLGSADPSQSTLKIWELLQDTYTMEYRELSGIHGAVKDLNANITGLVTSIVQTGGVEGFAASSFSSIGTAEKLFSDVFGQAYKAAANLFTLGLLPGLADKIGSTIGNIMGSLGSKIFGGGTTTTAYASGIQYGGASVGALAAGGGIDAQKYTSYMMQTDGGWLSSDSTSFVTTTSKLNTQVTTLLNKVFQNMGDTLIFLAQGLGTDVTKAMNYVFKAGKINLIGLDAEGINKKLTEYFSTLGDKAVQKLFGKIVAQYQQVGEGLMETAARLVIDKEIVVSVLDMTNQAFKGSTKKLIAFSEALIQMAGGLEALQDAAASYYDAFFTDAEKQARLQEQLTSLLSEFNLKLPKTRDGYRDLVEGLNLNTVAGQEAYVALLQAAESADAYYSMVEDVKEATTESKKSLKELVNWLDEINPSGVKFADTLSTIADGMDALSSAMQNYYDKFFNDAEKQARLKETLTSGLAQYGVSLPGTRDAYRSIVESLDLSTKAGQEAFTAMMNMASMADQYYSYLEAQSAALRAAIKPENYATRTEYEQALASIPKFATGGYFSGGLRVVGEKGPELEATGASRIWSNIQTRRMLGTDDLISEIRALRKDIQSGDLAIANINEKSRKIIDKWDRIGLPDTQS